MRLLYAAKAYRAYLDLCPPPGRSIIARAGVALYQVGACKSTPGGVNYVFVDGGMADNIRPALYGAAYTAFAVDRALDVHDQNFCASGRYCELGDILIEQVRLPLMREGDLLYLPTAGRIVCQCRVTITLFLVQP